MADEAPGELTKGKHAVIVIVCGMAFFIALFFGVAAHLKHEANARPPGAPPVPTTAPS